MCLVENNAILTKDNSIRRHWVGDPTCYFCHDNETIDHLFFQCSIAKVTWGIIGFCFGAIDSPRNFHQYKIWIAKWLPGGSLIYTSGCAVVCWAIWKCRNRACFDKKKTPQKPMWDYNICLFFSNFLGTRWHRRRFLMVCRSYWHVRTRCWQLNQIPGRRWGCFLLLWMIRKMMMATFELEDGSWSFGNLDSGCFPFFLLLSSKTVL